MGLGTALEAERCQPLLHFLPRDEAVHSGEIAAGFVDRAVEVQDVDLGETVALARGEVVEVVRGRHLHHSGAELRIDQHRVGDDGELAAVEGVPHLLAVEVCVAGVVRVHGDGGVAQHRLRPRRGDDELGGSAARIGVRDRVRELVELALDVLLDVHLEVGEHRLGGDVPVHEARRSVDEPVLVEPHEGLAHCALHVGVEGELQPVPVRGAAEHLHLLDDPAAALLLPLPDTRQKRFTPEIVARLALALELTLDDGLRGDPGVVDPWLPEHVEPLHALVAHEHVLDRAEHRVPHVQRARDVRRRHRDDVRLALVVRGEARAEDTVLGPEGEPASFDLGRLVRFRQLAHGGETLASTGGP